MTGPRTKPMGRMRPDMPTEIRWLRDALERTDCALRDTLDGRYIGDIEAVLTSNAWLLFSEDELEATR